MEMTKVFILVMNDNDFGNSVFFLQKILPCHIFNFHSCACAYLYIYFIVIIPKASFFFKPLNNNFARFY